jgi:FAD/FMN-containing dehydrogenase
MSGRLSRRATLKGAVAATLAAPVVSTMAAAGATKAAEPPLILDDASGLDATRVARHLRPRSNDSALIDALRRELKAAAADNRPVCVGGARHSMGGQSLSRDSTAITLDQGWCAPNAEAVRYRAPAGTRWREVIAALDPLGFAPKVTQANSDFTLGGAFSVNAHGWAAPLGPMGSTVRGATIMLADGEVVRCSPSVESGLFSLAMGGYGLFGVLLDLDVEMVPNTRLTPSYAQMPAAEFGPRFVKALHAPGVTMGYGRLSVARRNFFQDTLLVTFRQVEGRPARLSSEPDHLSGLTRQIYRAQIGSEAWKRARWYAETVLKPKLDPKLTTRNTLISSPVSDLADRNAHRTDILHEYFLPPANLGGFLADCRDIIPKSGAELLNVTLRYIAADPVSAMAFAPTERVAAVMSFSQPRTIEADSKMRPVTRALIDRAIAHGGSFYLPYRLHARADQLDRAYPNLERFIAEKRRRDPHGLFRNTMWDSYFAHRA